MYFLKYLETFEDIPEILKEEVFIKGFEIAEIANFNEEQMAEYEESLKVYRDLKGVVDTSFEEGEKVGIEKGIDKGREKERMDIAKKLKTEGINIEIIMKSTGLSKEEIEKL
jgi:predicted transposase/invertase (TIGR01784 family)